MAWETRRKTLSGHTRSGVLGLSVLVPDALMLNALKARAVSRQRFLFGLIVFKKKDTTTPLKHIKCDIEDFDEKRVLISRQSVVCKTERC